MSNLDQLYQEVSLCDLFLIVFLASSMNVRFHSAYSVQFLPHLPLVMATSQGVCDFDNITYQRSRQHAIVVPHPQ